MRDWFRRLLERFRSHAEVGAMTPQEREAHFSPKGKPARKAKVKRVNKKK